MKEKVIELLKSLKRQFVEIRNEFSKIIEYCESKTFLLLITFIILIVCHGYLLFNSNVGIDTDVFVNNPANNYNWMEIGRFGLIIEKNILNLKFFNMFYAEVLTIVFLFVFSVLCYYTIYRLSGKDFKNLNLILPLICFTNPIWAEAFIFVIQIAEISFALMLIVLANLFIYKGVLEKNRVSTIIGMSLLFLAMATYQSFIVVYIAICIVSFILVMENEEIKEEKFSMLKLALFVAITFILTFAMYQITLKILKIENTYLINAWKTATSKREVLKNIYYHCKAIILGEGLFYNLGLIISLIGIGIIGIYNSIKNKKNTKLFLKAIYYCVYLAFCMTPFLLTIYVGQNSVVRAEIYLPIIQALSTLYCAYFIKTKINNSLINLLLIISICYLGMNQAYYLESLYYTDYLTRERDKELVYQIGHDIAEAGAELEDKLYFYGHYNGLDNNSIIRGQLIGTSAFEYAHTTDPMYYWSSQTIVYLLRAYGYKYNWVPADMARQAREIAAPETVPWWPEKEGIIKCDGYWIIKINPF